MQTPPLSHRKFQILSGLLDGRERRECELRETLSLGIGNQQFTRHLQTLHADGLIEKSDVLARKRYEMEDGPHIRRHRYRLLKITEEGRRAWRETADWYLHYIERFAGESPAAPQTPQAETLTILTRTPVEPDREREEHNRARSRSVMARVRRLHTAAKRNGDSSRKRQ